MRLILFPLLLVSLMGCTSLKPKFVKGTPGYTIEKDLPPDALSLKVDLNGKADDKFSIFYGYRAIGEECLARGYAYYDVGVKDPHRFDGYCYKTADHPGLGIEFSELGLDARPQRFVISNLYGKTSTLLQKGDQVLAIDGTPVTSVAVVKAAIFHAVRGHANLVTLKIKRHKDELEIKEPIALFKNSSLGSTQLDLMREKIP